MRWFNYIFQNTEPPLWLRRLNYISLAGVIGWPLVAFGSIFLFDDPNGNFHNRMIYFLLLNSYPIILLLLSFISFKIYRYNLIAAAILPSIPIAAYATLLVFIAFVG